MSAITRRRYCGSIRARVTLLPCDTQYVVTLTDDQADPPSVSITVGAPAVLTMAVDSPEAFDSAAHAALSFASDEQWDAMDRANANGIGWVIDRKRQGV